mmetsp:Transcript_14674/g.37114  ORF Transcript_14674/g.37114 Transcript_14674/m.37114 type:complete len:222 (+) Transcript_14674:1-666(+)
MAKSKNKCQTIHRVCVLPRFPAWRTLVYTITLSSSLSSSSSSTSSLSLSSSVAATTSSSSWSLEFLQSLCPDSLVDIDIGVGIGIGIGSHCFSVSLKCSIRFLLLPVPGPLPDGLEVERAVVHEHPSVQVPRHDAAGVSQEGSSLRCQLDRDELQPSDVLQGHVEDSEEGSAGVRPVICKEGERRLVAEEHRGEADGTPRLDPRNRAQNVRNQDVHGVRGQ